MPGAPNAAPAPLDRIRYITRQTVAMLWLLVGLAGLAGIAEIWRYILLLRSRYGALSDGVVSASDTFVYTTAILGVAIGAIAVGLTVWWLYVARLAATEISGYLPARSNKHFFLGMLIPGVNLAVAGSVFAELEHAAERGDPAKRPKPSKLVRWWWIVWVVDGVLLAATVVWRFRDGVQAQADGVVLAALTDFVGGAVAVLTILLVRRLAKLLAPINAANVRLMRVVKVRDAPEPPLRAARSWGSIR